MSGKKGALELHPLDEAGEDIPQPGHMRLTRSPGGNLRGGTLLVGVRWSGRALWGHASSWLVHWPPGPEMLFEKTFPTRVKMSWYHSSHLETYCVHRPVSRMLG